MEKKNLKFHFWKYNNWDTPFAPGDLFLKTISVRHNMSDESVLWQKSRLRSYGPKDPEGVSPARQLFGGSPALVKKLIALIIAPILSLFSKNLIWTVPISVVRKLISIGTAFLFIWSMVIPSATAETITLEGGTVDVNVQDHITNVGVTGNPVWNLPEFNVTQGSTYNLTGLSAGASLAMLVNGGQASNIFGTLNLRDLAFILQNIAGINIGSAGLINLSNASFIASTIPMNLSMTNFLAQHYQFSALPAGRQGQGGYLSNEGRILGGEGDLVVLISNAIENKGTIEVPMGTVVLAAGKTVTIGLSGDGLISVGVDEATANAMGLKDQIKNTGTIQANGGRVILDAKAVDGLFEKAIHIQRSDKAVTAIQADDGTIEFKSMDDIYNDAVIQAQRGQITIQSTQGAVTNAGTMDAAKGSIDINTSGSIETRGILRAETLREHGYTFKMGGVIDVGHGYMDNLDGAADITAGLSLSGSWEDTGTINVLGNFSLSGDTVIWADQDEDGVGAILWGSSFGVTGNNHDLTVKASQNSTIGSVSGVKIFTLSESKASSAPTYTSDPTATTWENITDFQISSPVKLNRFTGAGTGGSPYLIYDVYGLQAMNGFLSSAFKLNGDIDASSTSGWNSGAGFNPIGNLATSFTSSFDGDHYTITGLFIYRPATDYVGLFGRLRNAGSSVKNVNMTGADITGQDYVGGLAGMNFKASTVDHNYFSGSVSGRDYVGGLIGFTSYSSAVSASYATGTVNGRNDVGGLAGWSQSTISQVYSKAVVIGTTKVGGLVGELGGGSLTDSYATGDVTGTNYVGGLTGYAGGTISRCYAGGDVTGSGGYVGGLAGYLSGGDSIANSFATGSVTGGFSVGGLVGGFWSSITNSYFLDATHDNGNGTVENGGIAAFYNSSHAVYNNPGSEWDFTTIWDSFASAVPHFKVENFVPPSIALFTWIYNGTGSNLWSLGLNWSGGDVPGEDDTSIFNPDYSIYDCLINTGSTVGAFTIQSGYSGTITQQGGLEIVGDYSQAGGQFECAVPDIYAFSVGGSFSVSGGTFERFAGSGTAEVPYLIYDVYGLQGMGGFLGSNFKLASNIDASPTTQWNWDGEKYLGFAPVGYSFDHPFNGSFDGDNHTVSDLYINRTDTDFVGLFGYTYGATIGSVDLEGGSVTGRDYVGGLVGFSMSSPTIDDVRVNLDVHGRNSVGGLAGYHWNGDVFSSWENNPVISNSSSEGDVVGTGYYVGGLVGYSWNAEIDQSDASGDVHGSWAVGGLVGFCQGVIISGSHATGDVYGDSGLGGLVGVSSISAILNSNSTGNVYGSSSGSSAGGLVGYSVYSLIDRSLASGDVWNGGEKMNNLVGNNISSFISDSQWQKAVSEIDLDPTTSADKDAAAKALKAMLEARMEDKTTTPDFFSQFFDPARAMNFITDVRVREGAVYTIDGVSAMSFLTQGESLSVDYKAKEAELARPGEKKPEAKPVPLVSEPVVVTASDLADTGQEKELLLRTYKPAPPVVTGHDEGAGRYGTLKNPGKDVFVKCQGGDWQAAKDGMVIMPGDVVKTAATSSVEVMLDGGKVGHVEIKEGSLFRINKAETDPATGDKTTLLELAIGKLIAHVEKLQGKSRFEVKSPTALTGVRGTVFEVEVKEKS